MIIWQVDFYRRPQQDSTQQIWELLICDPELNFKYEATVPQSDVNSTWITNQFQEASSQLPDIIQIFRPQSLNLVTQAGKNLGIQIEATRRTQAIKKWLQEKKHFPFLDKPPPLPLPENLWGEEWRFATINASDITDTFAERRIPVLEIPDFLLPINLGLASTTLIPGMVIFGGRGSMRLARWLEEIKPVELTYIPGQPDGLVLESGLVDRWIIATFEDPEVAIAGKKYQQRKQESQGLHFLLVQPDDSGMTYSGFWLLKAPD
ncbi:MAG: Tab2/Atab2 family RNA-binding protein [Cyanobacteria bacterium P01_A01_bin.45]